MDEDRILKQIHKLTEQDQLEWFTHITDAYDGKGNLKTSELSEATTEWSKFTLIFGGFESLLVVNYKNYSVYILDTDEVLERAIRANGERLLRRMEQEVLDLCS